MISSNNRVSKANEDNLDNSYEALQRVYLLDTPSIR